MNESDFRKMEQKYTNYTVINFLFVWNFIHFTIQIDQTRESWSGLIKFQRSETTGFYLSGFEYYGLLWTGGSFQVPLQKEQLSNLE